MGTPAFMSPEQARARWESSTRGPISGPSARRCSRCSRASIVHGAETAAELLIATATEPRARSRAWPARGARVVALVDRALAFERADRWPDARAMQVAVRRALKIDFDRPREPQVSLVDASVFQPTPPPSVGKATEVAFFGARDEREALTTAEGPPPASTASPPVSTSAVRASAFPSPSNHPAAMTQATGLMPTLPFQIPQPPGPLSSVPPPSAPPMSAPPASEPTTSAPVAGPAEPAIPTVPPPLPQPAVAAQSLRPTIVLGMFIAGGLAAGGATLGLMLRRPLPAAVVVAPATVETSAPSPPALAAPAPAPTPVEAAVGAFEAWRDAKLEEEELERHKLDRKIVEEEHWMRYGVTARRKRNMRRVGELADLRRERREALRPVGAAAMIAQDTKASGALVIDAERVSKALRRALGRAAISRCA